MDTETTTTSRAAVAQLGERLPCKQRVTGSIPVCGPNYRYWHHQNT